MFGIATIQFPYQSGMVPCRKKVQDYPGRNKRASEPERESVGLCRRIVLNTLELLQKEAEARHDEAKSHQSETSANPCKKRSLGGEIIAQVSPLLYFHGAIHFTARTRGATVAFAPSRFLTRQRLNSI